MTENNNDMPHNFWDYGINPILGYRYQPDGKAMPHKIRQLNATARTKS